MSHNKRSHRQQHSQRNEQSAAVEAKSTPKVLEKKAIAKTVKKIMKDNPGLLKRLFRAILSLFKRK